MSDQPHQPTGCESCDIHGPWLPFTLGWNAEKQRAHVAVHQLGRTLVAPLVALWGLLRGWSW